eukprot:g1473.t1
MTSEEAKVAAGGSDDKPSEAQQSLLADIVSLGRSLNGLETDGKLDRAAAKFLVLGHPGKVNTIATAMSGGQLERVATLKSEHKQLPTVKLHAPVEIAPRLPKVQVLEVGTFTPESLGNLIQTFEAALSQRVAAAFFFVSLAALAEEVQVGDAGETAVGAAGDADATKTKDFPKLVSAVESFRKLRNAAWFSHSRTSLLFDHGGDVNLEKLEGGLASLPPLPPNGADQVLKYGNVATALSIHLAGAFLAPEKTAAEKEKEQEEEEQEEEESKKIVEVADDEVDDASGKPGDEQAASWFEPSVKVNVVDCSQAGAMADGRNAVLGEILKKLASEAAKAREGAAASATGAVAAAAAAAPSSEPKWDETVN